VLARNRNFGLLFAARAISYFGTYLAPIAVAFAVLDLTGSATDTGIAFACWTVVQVSGGVAGLGGAHVGVVAERVDRAVLLDQVRAVLRARASIQSFLLAAHASFVIVAAAAVIAGFSFSLGSVMYETGVQRAIAPEKLSRVSAYSWMSAMVFLPLGYALAGPIADAVGMSTYLIFGGVWIIATTAVVIAVPAVRDYRLPAAVRAVS
jgi:hypothetical protein